jgi:hypothetical protein
MFAQSWPQNPGFKSPAAALDISPVLACEPAGFCIGEDGDCGFGFQEGLMFSGSMAWKGDGEGGESETDASTTVGSPMETRIASPPATGEGCQPRPPATGDFAGEGPLAVLGSGCPPVPAESLPTTTIAAERGASAGHSIVPEVTAVQQSRSSQVGWWEPLARQEPDAPLSASLFQLLPLRPVLALGLRREALAAAIDPAPPPLAAALWAAAAHAHDAATRRARLLLPASELGRCSAPGPGNGGSGDQAAGLLGRGSAALWEEEAEWGFLSVDLDPATQARASSSLSLPVSLGLPSFLRSYSLSLRPPSTRFLPLFSFFHKRFAPRSVCF